MTIGIYNKKELSLPRTFLGFLGCFRQRLWLSLLFHGAVIQFSEFIHFVFPPFVHGRTFHTLVKVSISQKSHCLFACVFAYTNSDITIQHDAQVSHLNPSLSLARPHLCDVF